MINEKDISSVGDDDLSAVPDEYRFDYSGACWWCGGKADSREHKWKRSEVVELFGRGQYGKSVVWGHDDEMENVRGPKAAAFMFSPTLCATCNGSRSQAFDFAYATWSSYLIANHARIVEQKSVSFADVFGNNVSDQLPNLARYYGKHIGCRVAENAGEVPEDLRSFLDGTADVARCVYSQFGVRTYLAELIEQHGHDLIGLHLRPSVANYSVEGRHLTSFKSAVGVGAVEFLFDVNLDSGRQNDGPGILPTPVQTLWNHEEDLYALRFGE